MNSRPCRRFGRLFWVAHVSILILALAAFGGSRAQEAKKELSASSLRGSVVDSEGRPVAEARVFHVADRQRVEADTDKDGGFRLQVALSSPGFVFVEKAGFRFHGQRCDTAEERKIALLRRDERVPKPMTSLPPALSRAERKKLAARLLDPWLERLREKSDDDRLQALRALARLDAGRLLQELESRPYKNAWFDAYLRRAAVEGLRHDSFDEARSLVDSIKDAGFRSMAYLDLADVLPESRRADKLTMLNQAILHSRAMEGNDHRVIQLAWIAKRLWAVGEKERATKLLRESQAIARELPTAGWAGYARGAFAEDLALIDLPAALELMKDLKDPMEYTRHHGNLAHKLGGVDPAESERVLHMLLKSKSAGAQGVYVFSSYAIRVCHRMAAADLPRARKIAEMIDDRYHKAHAHGVMALTLARSKPKEARELLDQAFDILARHVASGKDHFNNYYDAATMGGLLLPVAERIDPALVPEFFWRTVALHAPARDKRNDGMETGSLGARALVLSRYDRDLALVFVEAAAQSLPANEYRSEGYLVAAAIADPSKAVALVEKLADGPAKDRARETVAGALLAEGAELERFIYRKLALWHVDTEDL